MLDLVPALGEVLLSLGGKVLGLGSWIELLPFTGLDTLVVLGGVDWGTRVDGVGAGKVLAVVYIRSLPNNINNLEHPNLAKNLSIL